MSSLISKRRFCFFRPRRFSRDTFAETARTNILMRHPHLSLSCLKSGMIRISLSLAPETIRAPAPPTRPRTMREISATRDGRIKYPRGALQLIAVVNCANVCRDCESTAARRRRRRGAMRRDGLAISRGDIGRDVMCPRENEELAGNARKLRRP